MGPLPYEMGLGLEAPAPGFQDPWVPKTTLGLGLPLTTLGLVL